MKSPSPKPNKASAKPRAPADAAPAAALLAAQNRLLEGIATGTAPLSETLEGIARLIEAQAPGILCCVFLADSEGKRLRLGAGPGLPPSYADDLRRGFPIGPEAGTCGTAAYVRKPVFSGDIAADPKWQRCRNLPTNYGLHACWSTPILGAEGGAALGTFAVFYREIDPSTGHERDLIGEAVHLARIAIERDREEVRRRALLGEMLASLTNGRLRLCLSPDDIPPPLHDAAATVSLHDEKALRTLRRLVAGAAKIAHLPPEREMDIETAAHEAAMNAIVHGGDGATGAAATVSADAERALIQVRVSDGGPGIPEESLHRATLERGFTTAEKGFGHGFYLMLTQCDRVYLFTGPGGVGTTVLLEQERVARDPEWLERDRR